MDVVVTALLCENLEPAVQFLTVRPHSFDDLVTI